MLLSEEGLILYQQQTYLPLTDGIAVPISYKMLHVLESEIPFNLSASKNNMCK